VVKTLLLLAAAASLLCAEQAREVPQYGITWQFDRPHTVGRFVTGDYWVIGPVTVVSVTPPPGPAPGGTVTPEAFLQLPT